MKNIDSEPSLHTPYCYPSSALLDSTSLNQATPPDITDDDLNRTADRIIAVLKGFGVNATIPNITMGLSVVRYEVEFDADITIESITELSDEIRLHMGVENMRIAPIPDKPSLIGIDIPIHMPIMLHISDLLESDEFSSSSSPDTVIIGRGLDGENVVADLSTLSHILIAGSEGSGKTVFLDALITSMLYKASPEDLSFIMIDAKIADLNIFKDIPHLLFDIATDKQDILRTLDWLATEMDRRCNLFKSEDVTDIASYNEVVSGNTEKEKLPRVIVIIDHIAMLWGLHEVLEDSISHHAQEACKCGVHFIISTQQAEVEMISNILGFLSPSRIAFHISSQEGSQAILGNDDARRLTQCGDMLYLPTGTKTPKRVHGCYISEEEVARVVAYIKQKELVPNQISTTVSADQTKRESRKWDERSFLEQVKNTSGSIAVEICEKLLRVFERYRFWWGEGLFFGSFWVMYDKQQTNHYMFVVKNTGKNTNIQLCFKDIKPPLNTVEQKAKIKAALEEIPGVHIPDYKFDKCPTFSVMALHDEKNFDIFVNAMKAYTEDIDEHEGCT